jgi:hypothetical protein
MQGNWKSFIERPKSRLIYPAELWAQLLCHQTGNDVSSSPDIVTVIKLGPRWLEKGLGTYTKALFNLDFLKVKLSLYLTN